jgi:hypothetical protein
VVLISDFFRGFTEYATTALGDDEEEEVAVEDEEDLAEAGARPVFTLRCQLQMMRQDSA